MAAKNIINIDDLKFIPFGNGEKFEAKFGMIGRAIGAQQLGYNLTVLPPGKAGFPYHLHHSNEEMFFILKGKGTLRYAGEKYPVKKGDVIACPAGPEGGHQIINTGKKDLKYLAISTSKNPEVAEYPDSGKVGALCGTFEKPDLRLIVKKESGVDYFDGESD